MTSETVVGMLGTDACMKSGMPNLRLQSSVVWLCSQVVVSGCRHLMPERWRCQPCPQLSMCAHASGCAEFVASGVWPCRWPRSSCRSARLIRMQRPTT